MSRVLLVIGVLLVAVLIIFLRQQGTATQPTQTAVSESLGGTSQNNTSTGQANSLGGDATGNVVNQTPNPYENEVVKAQIMQVADLYAERSKYPHFSQPILNPEEFKEPQPYEETEVDTPFPQEDEAQPIRLQLATERYQYFAADTVRARLRVVNVAADSFVTARGTLASASGDTSLSVDFQPGLLPNEYFASFDTSLLNAAQLSPEMLLKVVVEVDQAPFFTTVGFRYQLAEAQLTGIAWARPEGEYLQIALQYSVNRTGYYFTSAVLADAESGRPLIELQGEGRMQQGNDLLYLQAHSQALRAVASEGPYVLRTIRGYRGAEVGETFDKPVSSLAPEYPVFGYPFDQYTDTEYVDPLAQERAEFLRQLGSADSNTEEE